MNDTQAKNRPHDFVTTHHWLSPYETNNFFKGRSVVKIGSV